MIVGNTNNHITAWKQFWPSYEANQR